ncbi:MAG: polyamine aminopropyltransferase [Candidatus Baldrarchaeia archaeon]
MPSSSSIDIGGMLYHERLTRSLSRLVQINRVIFSGTTKYQRVEIVESPDFGKMLLIDGKVQLSTFDEYIYHESLVHPSLFSHPRPEKVLIIGGGDGGALEEVLKHNVVKEVVLVDLDKEIIEISKKYLKEVHKDAFNDERVSIFIEDGRRFVERTNDKFDVVILDLTDPSGQSARLYTVEFYKLIKSRLNSNGIVTTHSESPYVYQREFVAIYKTLSEVFSIVRPYGAWIPSFGLYWMFIIASDHIDPRSISKDLIKKRFEERGVYTEYYSPELHEALFVLPKDILMALKRTDVPVSTDEKPIEIPV